MNATILKTACIAAAFSAAAVTLFCTGSGAGSDTAAKSKFDPADDRHQASYVIGRNFGDEMKELGEYADIDIVIMAIKEAQSGVPSQLSDSAMTAVTARVRREQRDIQRQARKQIEDNNLAAATAFLEQNKTKEGVITTESGLQYIVLTEGKGAKPKPEDRVRVHYHGTLPDGTVFDSSVQRGDPASFAVTGVIRGWTEALQLMNTGSKFKIFVPPELAYGRRGSRAPIGPNMALIFEIELIEIEK